MPDVLPQFSLSLDVTLRPLLASVYLSRIAVGILTGASVQDSCPQGCLMDTARLEALERHIAQLIQAFTRVKEENTRLAQNLVQLQQTLYEQQRTLEHWQSAQAELTRLRTITQALRRERELIREKLEEMLVAIERLEGLSAVPSDSKV